MNKARELNPNSKQDGPVDNATRVARQNQDFHTSEVMAKGYIRVSSLAISGRI